MAEVRWVAIFMGQATEGREAVAELPQVDGEIVVPADDRTIEVVAPVGLPEIGMDPSRSTWQMLKPLVQTALKRVGMTVDVYEGMGCGEIEFLQPAPQGCTMIVHHVDIARFAEKIPFDGP